MIKKEEINMKNNIINYDVEIQIEGMGFVIYSKGAVLDIKEGDDYFDKEFATPEQVASHIRKGDIVGFNTGSGGTYNIKFRTGYPSKIVDEQYPISIRLAIDVKGGEISIIDLFWLLDWSSECPAEQRIAVDDGIYHLTILTAKPQSNIWGDHQDIYIYLNKLETMPELTWTGVPALFTL